MPLGARSDLGGCVRAPGCTRRRSAAIDHPQAGQQRRHEGLQHVVGGGRRRVDPRLRGDRRRRRPRRWAGTRRAACAWTDGGIPVGRHRVRSLGVARTQARCERRKEGRQHLGPWSDRLLGRLAGWLRPSGGGPSARGGSGAVQARCRSPGAARGRRPCAQRREYRRDPHEGVGEQRRSHVGRNPRGRKPEQRPGGSFRPGRLRVAGSGAHG